MSRLNMEHEDGLAISFRESTDRMQPSMDLAAIAQSVGLSYARIRQATLPGCDPGHRPPPPNWRTVLARLARERAQELEELAAEIEGPGEARR